MSFIQSIFTDISRVSSFFEFINFCSNYHKSWYISRKSLSSLVHCFVRTFHDTTQKNHQGHILILVLIPNEVSIPSPKKYIWGTWQEAYNFAANPRIDYHQKGLDSLVYNVFWWQNSWKGTYKSVQMQSFCWSVFSCIFLIQENADQKKLRIWTLFTQWTMRKLKEKKIIPTSMENIWSKDLANMRH